MERDLFFETLQKLGAKKKGKKEELEKVQKLFERFHLLNRKYLDKETFEKAQESIPAISDAIANTLRFLDEEIARLRTKRIKVPFENLDLNEMQKTQAHNDLLLKEFLASFKES